MMKNPLNKNFEFTKKIEFESERKWSKTLKKNFKIYKKSIF